MSLPKFKDVDAESMYVGTLVAGGICTFMILIFLTVYTNNKNYHIQEMAKIGNCFISYGYTVETSEHWVQEDYCGRTLPE